MSMQRNDKPYRYGDRAGWYVTVYDEDGNRRRLKGGDTYEQAVTFQSRFEDRARLVRDGLVSRKQLDLAEAGRVPFNGRLDEFKRDLDSRGKSEKYVAEVDHYVHRLFARARAKRAVDVTPSDVRRWLKQAYLDRGRSASTHNHALARVRAFFRWCVKQRYLGEDPTFGIAKHNEDADARQPARALTHEELRSLITACPNKRRKLWYLLGARAGLRWTEISRLTWSHLDVRDGWIRLDAALTKSKRGDDLPMAPEIIEAAKKVKPTDAEPGDPVFTSKPTRITWLRDLSKAGLIEIDGHLNPHWKDGEKIAPSYDLIGYRDDRGRVLSRQCLRKTFGTHLAMVEPNISTVAKLMRHTDPKLTVRLYEDARLMDLRGSVSKLPGATSVPLEVEQDGTERDTGRPRLAG